MSLWLLHHSVCHYNFCSLCHYGFCIILSVIMASVHYVIMASASFCLSFWLLSLMSLRLLSPCYFVFYILCPLCLPFILSGLEGFCVKYFYELTILSVTCECRVGQYLPFLSRTFKDEFVIIKNTIVYKIKQRKQNSGNHKFIYGRSTEKEVKERKNRYEKGEFVYIFHYEALFFPYSSHLTS